MKARLYLSYTSGDPWVLTWDGLRRTFATLTEARQYAKTNGIKI